jgi:hypothetical protein
VSKNQFIKLVNESLKQKCVGDFLLTFTVTNNGTINQVELKENYLDCKEYSEKLIKNLPNYGVQWIPAIKDNTEVDFKMSLQIKLEKKKNK